MAVCGKCKQPVRWVTTTAQGKRLPLDPSSDDDGTIRLRVSGPEGKAATTWADVLSGRELDAARADGDLMFLAHRCPARAEHNPMPAEARAIRDALPTPKPQPRRRTR